MTKKLTFVPTYEHKDVQISEQTYENKDSVRYGETFLSIKSGAMTVHGNKLSMERINDKVSLTVWEIEERYEKQQLVVKFYIDDETAKEIRETFEGYL